MTTYDVAIEAGGATPPATVPVWDRAVRAFHWSLVALVAAALGTGFFAPPWWLGAHVAAGTAVALLVCFRLAWGVWGSTYARFRSFAFPPRAVAAHVAGVLRRRPHAHLGHNPAGGLMIFALIAVLSTLCVTGLVALGGQEKQGPLKLVTSYATGHTAWTVHAVLAWLLVGMIAVHVLGVVVESALTRDALVRAMVTGRKARMPGQPRTRPGRPLPAIAAVLAVAGLGAALHLATADRPALGVRSLPLPQAYRAACGDCHTPHHPSLLPAGSWAVLMNGLDDHFGEDASLDAGTRDAIRAFLAADAAESWDTEAANNLRAVARDAPTRITRTEFWQRRHAAIAPATFESKAVGGRANCAACHRDADTGRFDDQSISPPQETRR